MAKGLSLFIVCVLLHFWGQFQSTMAQTIDLSGAWKVKQETKQTTQQEMFLTAGFEETVILPGCLHAQGIGNDVTPETKWYLGGLSTLWHNHPMYEQFRQPGNVRIFDFLQPAKHYVGAAWYKRTFNIPHPVEHKEFFLYLERVHWESTLYINGRKAGVNRGLGTAHEYNITSFIEEGENEIAIRIDNSAIVDVGRIPHSVSEQTMAAWNGIIGEMKIDVKEKIWIDEVQVFPDVDRGVAVVKLTVGSRLNEQESVKIKLGAELYNTKHTYKEKSTSKNVAVTPHGLTTFTIEYPFSGEMQCWDEFSPALYRLDISLESSRAGDQYSTSFAFRKPELNGRRFMLNGKTISIRGNLNCGEFPVDGLPSMDVAWWKKIFYLHKSWGHNMVRFHSWCPPKAAFIAADEVGIYLQPEASEWGVILSPEQEQFIVEETDRMIRQYGNHASWLFFAMGNELRADTAIMIRFIEKAKQDSRRFVSGKINGRPVLDSFDFAVSHSVNKKRVRHHMGWPPKPETNLLFHMQPNTAYDYNDAIREFPKPFLSHEIGQYCVFPDYEHEIPKYTGSLYPGVLDIQKTLMAERGMTKLAPQFTEATGKWQVELLKAEYEAVLRTKDIAGFHSLSLQDFPGQGHAPVGVFDAFWDVKKHVTRSEFTRFCNETVLLARIPSLILQQKDTFQATVELYNFAEKPILQKQVVYQITDESGKVIHQGKFNKMNYPTRENNMHIGTVSLNLSKLHSPTKYTFTLQMEGTDIRNRWSFWVFPDDIESYSGDVRIVRELNDEVIKDLNQGAKVLWLTDRSKLKGNLPTCFASIYWTAFGLNEGETMCNSILCNPEHPVFGQFPTEMHTNWQWWDVLKYSVPMILDEHGAENAFPKEYQPLLQAIDSWKVNRKLALLAECKVGRGKLMISSVDFETDMDKRTATRQLYKSLLNYMNSGEFNPEFSLNKETILSIYGVTVEDEKKESVPNAVLPTEG